MAKSTKSAKPRFGTWTSIKQPPVRNEEQPDQNEVLVVYTSGTNGRSYMTVANFTVVNGHYTWYAWDCETRIQPTHWMPLPPAPQKSGGR